MSGDVSIDVKLLQEKNIQEVFETLADVEAGTNVKATVDGTFADGAATTFTKPEGQNWLGCFFKVTYTMTTTAASSNKGAVITEIALNFVGE